MKKRKLRKILICGNLYNDFTVARFYPGEDLSIPDINADIAYFSPNPANTLIHFKTNVKNFAIILIFLKKSASCRHTVRWRFFAVVRKAC